MTRVGVQGERRLCSKRVERVVKEGSKLTRAEGDSCVLRFCAHVLVCQHHCAPKSSFGQHALLIGRGSGGMPCAHHLAYSQVTGSIPGCRGGVGNT